MYCFLIKNEADWELIVPTSLVLISSNLLVHNCTHCLIPLTDWAQNAHSLTVQRGQNAHYVPSLYRVLASDSLVHLPV